MGALDDGIDALAKENWLEVCVAQECRLSIQVFGPKFASHVAASKSQFIAAFEMFFFLRESFDISNIKKILNAFHPSV